MSRKYTYCPRAHEELIKSRNKNEVSGLIISLADLIERECGSVISGADKQSICNFRKDNKMCVDGDEFFQRFFPGEHQIDILLGVSEGQCKQILIADCKIQMKGGASITNLKSIPDVCANIFEKYKSAKKNINSTIPITRMYIIFNHAVASQARRFLFRCLHGTNTNCRLVSCFKFECLTIEEFRKLVR